MTKEKKLLITGCSLYLLSFALPTYPISDGEDAMGYEAFFAVLKGDAELFVHSNTLVIGLQYVLMNLANVLILILLISEFSQTGSKRLKFYVGTFALLTAFIFFPYFISVLYSYFSFGYYCWLIGIFMMVYYSNEGSFKKPVST